MSIIATIVFALQSTVAGAASDTADTAPTPPASACSTEQHSAFDLWVGEWDVFPTGKDNKIADSKIEKISSGCVIRETWMPLSGGGGTSMSMVNHHTGRWEQVWVGSDGTRVDFAGGPIDGAMVITGYWDGIGPGGSDVLIRMTYSLEDDGSVRQFGQGSTDHGKTWQTSFDLTYRRKAAS